jgi:hypothetical protein
MAGQTAAASDDISNYFDSCGSVLCPGILSLAAL